MRLYMPRFYVRDVETNLVALRRDVADAAAQGCDAVMFPEVFLTGYRGQLDPARAREVFTELSAAHPRLLCLFGSLSEDGRNRLPVYLAGQQLASYDKVHLFLPNAEDELWTPGDCLCAVEHGPWRIGLAICNDVRFPELARELKLQADMNLLVFPALWPWQRDHIWAALLRARAIENGCFAVGCCVAGVDNGAELFDGAGNYAFDPLGNAILPSGPAGQPGRVYELDAGVLERITVDTRAQHRDVTTVKRFPG